MMFQTFPPTFVMELKESLKLIKLTYRIFLQIYHMKVYVMHNSDLLF